MYANRGIGASAEYRYVLSEQQRGTAAGFLLQEVFKHDATRGDFSLRHDWAIAPGLTFKVDGNIVTDDKVLSDYGDRLQQRSRAAGGVERLPHEIVGVVELRRQHVRLPGPHHSGGRSS